MAYQYPEEASSPIELIPVLGDESEPEQGVLALEALRKARPGIVIEANGPPIRKREQGLIPSEYDTANRLQSQAVREAIRQWKATGSPTPPPGKPTGGGIF